ncbi:hypothetical protein Q6247_25630, partial [Klebsiella pneumoniae]
MQQNKIQYKYILIVFIFFKNQSTLRICVGLLHFKFPSVPPTLNLDVAAACWPRRPSPAGVVAPTLYDDDAVDAVGRS